MFSVTQVLFLALTATAAIHRRDATLVDNDIRLKIGPQTKTLNEDVNGFPASGLAGAFAIHDDYQGVTATLNNATSDVKSSGSFSEKESTNILASLQALTSTFLGTLSAIENQAAAWANIPGGQDLILADLQGYNASFVDFVDSLIAASPTDLVPSATSFKTQLVGGFNSAIDAYFIYRSSWICYYILRSIVASVTILGGRASCPRMASNSD